MRVEWFLVWVICSQFLFVADVQPKIQAVRDIQIVFVSLVLFLMSGIGLENPIIIWAMMATIAAAVALDKARIVWKRLGFAFELEVAALVLGYALIWWLAPYCVGTPYFQNLNEIWKDVSSASAWLAAILLASSPSDRLVRLFLEKGGKIAPSKELAMEGQKFVIKDSGEAYRAGALIGNLERLIVLALTVYGKIDAVALLFAGKGLVRFKKFEENPEFGEYFIVGTLSSAAIAVAIALVTKQLLAT